MGCQACALINGGDGNCNKEIDIMDATWDRMVRPNYLEMEKKISKVLPKSLWMQMYRRRDLSSKEGTIIDSHLHGIHDIII